MQYSRLLHLDSAATKRHDRALALCAIAGVIGILEVKFAGISFGSGFEMVSIARSLATSGTFANPFSVFETGTTAVSPPVYPLILAAFFKILGSESAVTLAATILSIVMNAFTAALLPYLSFALLEDELPGLIASLLWIGAMQALPSWDVNCTVTALLAFCLITISQIKTEVASKGILTGLLGSIVLLLNTTTLLIVLPWLACLFVAHRNRGKRAYLGVVIAFLCLLPLTWAVRNYRQLGTFAPRVNFGITLYASNNDCARPTIIEEEAQNCFQEHHPNESLSEAVQVEQVGEVEYDRQRLGIAALWIRNNPNRFLHLTVGRFKEFWFPTNEPGSRWHVLFFWLATLLSIPGMYFLWRRNRSTFWLCFLGLALYPLPYYVVISDVRYRYPALWLSLLPVGYFIAQLLHGDRAARSATTV